MSNQTLPSVDPATASGSKKKNFDRLRSAPGFIPNMALAMAKSAAVLDGYISLSGALAKVRLGKRFMEELALTLAATSRCEYCASAHTASGKLAVLKETDVAAALQVEPRMSGKQRQTLLGIEVVQSISPKWIFVNGPR